MCLYIGVWMHACLSACMSECMRCWLAGRRVSRQAWINKLCMYPIWSPAPLMMTTHIFRRSRPHWQYLYRTTNILYFRNNRLGYNVCFGCDSFKPDLYSIHSMTVSLQIRYFLQAMVWLIFDQFLVRPLELKLFSSATPSCLRADWLLYCQNSSKLCKLMVYPVLYMDKHKSQMLCLGNKMPCDVSHNKK